MSAPASWPAALREDPRVRVWEQTNVRDIDLRQVGRPVDLAVADLSFISLITVLDPIIAVTAPEGRLLLLVKPQFEVGRELLGKGGVVRSEALRRQAVDSVVAAAAERGWSAKAVVPSRLPGPAGNVEYFALFTRVTAADLRESDVEPLGDGRHRTAAAAGRGSPLCCDR